MKQNFNSLPQYQWNSELSSPALVHVQKEESGKISLKQCLCANFERMVSILVIIYFLTLIVKLTAMKEPSLLVKSLPKEEKEEYRVKAEKLIDLDEFRSKSDAQTHHQTTNPTLNNPPSQAENDGKQKRILARSTNYLQNQPTQITDNKIQNQNPNSPSAQTKEKDQVHSQQTVSDGSSMKELLREVALQEFHRNSAKIYSQFSKIYQQMDQNLRKSVRALPLDQRQAVIQKHFKQPHQNPLFSILLKENQELNPRQSKEDSKHDKLLNDEQDLKGEDHTFICAILTTRNNAMNGQITLTLNSIFNQQYQEYQVVIADAASSDNTVSIIEQYLKNIEWVKDKVKIVKLDTGSQAKAVLTAVGQCRQDSLAVFFDGNTELVGKGAFGIIDSEYRLSNALMLYPQQLFLDVSKREITLHRAQRYDQSQTFTQIYRHSAQKYGRLFAARSATLQNIPEDHIQHNGKYFEYSSIDSIAVSLLEMSCGRIRTIDESIALSMVDSEIQGEQKRERGHELGMIATKKKLDFC